MVEDVTSKKLAALANTMAAGRLIFFFDKPDETAHKCLPFGFKKVPHVIVADDAFALKTYIMKPYPQKGLIEDKRIYNYCLSCAKKNCRVYVAKILKQCNPSLDVVLYRATPHTSKRCTPLPDDDAGKRNPPFLPSLESNLKPVPLSHEAVTRKDE